MIRLVSAAALLFASLPALAQSPEMARWKAEAARVEIVRDDWGIAHVHGKTDADAVFGMVYAQAEDDFNRVEMNYATALGRAAETEGESALWQDLRQRLFLDPTQLEAQYASSPAWLKKLMDAWADGLNYYLATHPEVHPKVIADYAPWMALSFSEGSIGGDIERVSLSRLQAFYGGDDVPLPFAEDKDVFREPSGSNGFAIAPRNTADGHAELLINPHTSFYFRSELQMTSDEGLNAYGAVTWGQFFVYQGFNPHLGWMHTSSGVDVVDEFAETIVKKDGKLFYRYGDALRPVRVSQMTLKYATADGVKDRTFTVYHTHHGPIVRAADGKWIAEALMNRPVPALEQSFLRTKARDFASYMKVMALKANSSNNTIYADDEGNIAYLHPQFIPLRDDRFDYTQPVDGSDPATDWHGLTPLEDIPHLTNPANGWIKNTNDWPWTIAGENSPKAKNFPRYMDQWGENPRGLHAVRVLTSRHDFTLQKLIDAAFDPYLPAFAEIVPPLIADHDAMPDGNPLKARTAAQIDLLRQWDFTWGAGSTATSLAIFWGEALWNAVAPDARAQGMDVYDYMARRATPAQKLTALDEAAGKLAFEFDSWKVPWGQINRFQRLDDRIDSHFDDSKPSIPVPFASAQWGSLASFGARAYPNTNRYYGTSGNSFVAVVAFGPRVTARAVTAGGESGHPDSKHFDDEAERYASGDLRDVYFYPEQLRGHIERRYRPGS